METMKLKLVSLPLVALALTGCSFTMGAVNPRPNVVVGRKVTTLAVDTAKVVDVQEPKGTSPNGTIYLSHVHINEFRTTLENGFRNAVGAHYASGTAPVKLVFDSADLEFSNLGGLGRFLTIRYRAHWETGRGDLIAEVAGTAQPRNPTETGVRHLEDVVEVMYEKLIDGLDKTK
jgi:hypothetical protein